MQYVAKKAFSIEQATFKPGDVLGNGDVEAGKFTPVESAKIVQCGHVIPRLVVGQIEAIQEPESVKKPTTTTKKTKGKKR